VVKKIFFSGLFLLCTQLLQCMDEPNIESSHLLKKKSEAESNKQHLANMLQAQGRDLYMHDSWEQRESTVFSKVSLGFVWQADGNACGNVVIEEESVPKDHKNIKSKILLERYHIENKELKCHKKEWDNVQFKGSTYPCLFDEKGDFSFYARGTVDQKKQVCGYTLFSDGKSAIYPCVLSYKKGICATSTPLVTLKNQVFLLQDILRSLSSLGVDENGESVRVFKIEDIVFSDHYTRLTTEWNFWLSQYILTKMTGPLYVEVIFPEEQKEEVFDAETYFADKREFIPEKDELQDIRRALKMAIWYQCLYEKVNAIHVPL